MTWNTRKTNADSTIPDGSITEPKLADDSVNMRVIDDDIKDASNGIPVLDSNGNLDGPIVPYKDTAAAINAIQLPEGFFAYTTDTKTIRIGNGTTMGGDVWSKD